MSRFLMILFIAFPFFCSGQPNCNIYKLKNDTSCYRACLIAVDAEKAQGSRSGQLEYDKAIQLCPSLDYAYREKSVPYLKRGDFIEWKILMDKAVELNPLENLGYRGWCRYQFLRDNSGAIEDLERLSILKQEENLGYSQNGDYQLNIVKAICYKALGEKKKAVEIIEKQLATKEYFPKNYDYLHLGVLEMEMGNKEKAISCFQKSISLGYEFAEVYYYLGLIYKQQKLMKKATANFEKAMTRYLKGQRMFDHYTNPVDKIYWEDLKQALNQ